MVRLGIDIDGVIYNFVKALRLWIHKRTGRPLAEMPDANCWNFFKDQWGYTTAEYIQFIIDGMAHGNLMWEGDQYPGAWEALHDLNYDGYYITLITARNYEGVETLGRYATEYWLMKNNIPYDELIITNEKQGHDFDLAIDDAPHNIEVYEAEGTSALIFTQPWNEHILTTPRTRGWEDTYAYIQKNFPINYLTSLPGSTKLGLASSNINNNTKENNVNE